MIKVIFDRCAFQGEPPKADIEIPCDTMQEARVIAEEIANDPRDIAINIRVKDSHD